MGNIPLKTENGIVKQNRDEPGLGAIEAQRFPHLGEAIFGELEDQNLVLCRAVSRPWLNYLDQQKFFKIRRILSYVEKFHKVRGDWNRFLRCKNTEMLNRLESAMKTSLLNNGRKHLLPITEFFKEFMTENCTELTSLAYTLKEPITQEIFDTALATETIERDSSNILLYGFWTQTQAFLMELADKLPRVIIIGGTGTGKTAMLEAFAARKAKEKPEANVTFAIQHYNKSTQPLLKLDLEINCEKLENMTVTKFEKMKEFNHDLLTNSTICIDNIDMYYVKRKDLLNIKSKNLWVVIQDTNRGYETFMGENPEDYLRNQFPDWVIVNLRYPLRTCKQISEIVRTGYWFKFNTIFNKNFNASMDVSVNMPLGPEYLILPRSEGSYHARLQHAFSVVGKDKPALIILELWSMNSTTEEIKEARKTTLHKELAEKTDEHTSRNLLVGIEAAKACNRDPPLLWFEFAKFHQLSINDEEDIKEWMRGRNETFSGRHLISDIHCVTGYEADLVIYLGSDLQRQVSKCRGQFVHIE